MKPSLVSAASRLPLRSLGALLCGSALVACSATPGADPETFAVPTATAAPIRMEVCKPGTFIGTMTVNCPRGTK